ncbi:IS110 family RNA-guided transposase [Paenimyroides aestuarii]|uniref:IS110 family transposase n=1 Tax=Paenimyroides aestuarii TaxID=2968490 RepID=A0ABY5NQF5_9FLAO|nr:IS110 family transposase [Paenimyroides aestuarii]UUV20763.1 IS110 family transposase [Paenimyroides aestuarii]UUV20774.1 IS110 family transposase [Paenimyroides aestuarii]
MKILKQVLGVDVAQDELVVALGTLHEDLTIETKNYQVFCNNEKGFKSLLQWVDKTKSKDVEVVFVMESTGVYHERFAYFLYDKGEKVVIVLPTKISNFMRTLDIKTITDKSCSIAIAQFGLSRKLEEWQPSNKVYKELQQLSREKNQVISERVVCMNQLHAEKAEAMPNIRTIKRLKARISLLEKQEKEINTDMLKEVENSQEASEAIQYMSSIPGVGKATAIAILAETNGFELIRNKKQLTSYAGLDIREKQSGTSVKGKARISKKGNRNLRKTLHFPSMTAVKFNQEHRELYQRIVNKTGVKMKGLVAVQRKLLELTYILYKTKTFYEVNFEENRAKTQIDFHPIEANL